MKNKKKTKKTNNNNYKKKVKQSVDKCLVFFPVFFLKGGGALFTLVYFSYFHGKPL